MLVTELPTTLQTHTAPQNHHTREIHMQNNLRMEPIIQLMTAIATSTDPLMSTATTAAIDRLIVSLLSPNSASAPSLQGFQDLKRCDSTTFRRWVRCVEHFNQLTGIPHIVIARYKSSEIARAFLKDMPLRWEDVVRELEKRIVPSRNRSRSLPSMETAGTPPQSQTNAATTNYHTVKRRTSPVTISPSDTESDTDDDTLSTTSDEVPPTTITESAENRQDTLPTSNDVQHIFRSLLGSYEYAALQPRPDITPFPLHMPSTDTDSHTTDTENDLSNSWIIPINPGLLPSGFPDYIVIDNPHLDNPQVCPLDNIIAVKFPEDIPPLNAHPGAATA